MCRQTRIIIGVNFFPSPWVTRHSNQKDIPGLKLNDSSTIGDRQRRPGFLWCECEDHDQNLQAFAWKFENRKWDIIKGGFLTPMNVMKLHSKNDIRISTGDMVMERCLLCQGPIWQLARIERWPCRSCNRTFILHPECLQEVLISMTYSTTPTR